MIVAVLRAQRRQFNTLDELKPLAAAGQVNGHHGPGGGEGPLPPLQPDGLSQLLSSTIRAANGVKPRNSGEAAALSTLHGALESALGGEFGMEVRRQIDEIEAVEALHDVRDRRARNGRGEPTRIDHLVVAPSGVIVLESRVRTGRISLDDDAVYVGRGSDRDRDPMVDEVLRKMVLVAELIAPVPVHGMVVLRDVLAVPKEIRAGEVLIKGVRLVTAAVLERELSEAGPLIDLDEIIDRLGTSFAPAMGPVEPDPQPSALGTASN